ncbi:hypothetical protein ACOSQ3_029759 [Xanthoceras sorbifolium]
MVFHALWGCRKHKLVRKNFSSIAALGDRGYCSFLDFVLDCLGVPSLQDLEVLRVICYHSACSKSASSSPRLCLKWEAPSPSWFKINSDAALDVPHKKIGIGVVIRDWEGRLADACVYAIAAKPSAKGLVPEMTEPSPIH